MSAPQRMSPQHFVSIGVYTAIYFVILFAGGMLGVAGPAFILVGGFVGNLLNGTVVMLYLVKVPMRGALASLGLVCGLLMALTGHVWYTPVISLAFGALADAIAASGEFRSRARNVLAYAVFSLWGIAPVLPVFYQADAYFQDVSERMGDAYAETMRSIFTPWIVVVWMAVGFVVSLAAAWFGTKLLDKHFAKAGLV